MDHATTPVLDDVELNCHLNIAEALEAQRERAEALRLAIADAYEAGIPSHKVAGWLGWSRASYYRYLASAGITSSERAHQ